ncbi:MAG: YlbF family regulator [Lachnospiraceae bacterium]|nr:YlbF family regulator [Lachnospiraceae bacterium]
MLELHEQLDEFIVALKHSKVYLEYQEQLKRLCAQPELKQRVDDYRRRNYEIQTQSQQQNMFDEMERFQRESEHLRDIPMVHDFLNAELALCRMIQKVTTTIVEAVSEDFD